VPERLRVELELALSEPVSGSIVAASGATPGLLRMMEMHIALESLYAEARGREGPRKIVEGPRGEADWRAGG
jgi:hypothetical protein